MLFTLTLTHFACFCKCHKTINILIKIHLIIKTFLRYKWLDRTFPGTTKTIIVKKLVLDQFILTPYLLTVFYAGKF